MFVIDSRIYKLINLRVSGGGKIFIYCLEIFMQHDLQVNEHVFMQVYRDNVHVEIYCGQAEVEATTCLSVLGGYFLIRVEI